MPHPRNVFLIADAPVVADVVNVGSSLLGLVAGKFAKFDLPPTADDHRRVLAVLAHLRAL